MEKGVYKVVEYADAIKVRLDRGCADIVGISYL